MGGWIETKEFIIIRFQLHFQMHIVMLIGNCFILYWDQPYFLSTRPTYLYFTQKAKIDQHPTYFLITSNYRPCQRPAFLHNLINSGGPSPSGCSCLCNVCPTQLCTIPSMCFTNSFMMDTGQPAAPTHLPNDGILDLENNQSTTQGDLPPT